MNFDNLTDENILLYAVKAYESPVCIISEFEADYKRVKYIKRLIRRYKTEGELRDRNILNHIIIFYNVFGIPAATRILFFKIDRKDFDVLKSFLSFLNFMPDVVYGIKNMNINSADIIECDDVLEKLRRVTQNG